MKEIPVTVEDFGKNCPLLPRYDAEANILSVTFSHANDWPYGIDIDGNIVFDLDVKRRLVNFDLHIPRYNWPNGEVREWPPESMPVALAFEEKAISHKSFNLPIRLCYDKGRGILSIYFGLKKAEYVCHLSKHCVALLHGKNLIGFLIKDSNSN